jgi:endonuclease III
MVTIMEKIPFEIDTVIARLREAVKPFPPAAMFQLYDEGYTTLFEQLIACIISIRTYDETTVPTARQLFTRVRTPQETARLLPAEIDALIHASSFHERKAGQILAISRRVLHEFKGELPCDEQVLLSFSGVGIKCAHLALGVACGLPYISVDIHVHRVTNRWGYVRAASPEKTSAALEEKLPIQYRVEINRLLVPFGKHICTGTQPKCSTCPLLDMCQQVGVTSHR